MEAEEWKLLRVVQHVAGARGCVMELMFYGWMPPGCVFVRLIQSLAVFEDRKYYSDENMTQALRPEQLWAAEYNIIINTSRYLAWY
ncbi:hypothetical protein DL762_003592 [Monosporascus cannonballus]|uniref:Heterokaryon incompatibility domain-containing protein n=1 Tax=Monosporascus cannonballus TaxID=155416 RepID=A0ABY0HA36_9PEZI|nr:hypothetical protein DL762_003592 [Monosporascus cannonballus]RYO93942.1 hypothetical protein DL763_004216 [Monosporascus cannonballus]